MESEATRKRSESWSYHETQLLVSVWADEKIQRSLEEMTRNKCVWEVVSGKFNSSNSFGYRSWVQCKEKIRGLVSTYRKVKNNNNRSGSGRKSCPFYAEIDAVLCTRALTEPPSTVQSLIDQSNTVEVVEMAVESATEEYGNQDLSAIYQSTLDPVIQFTDA
ncbi:Uncharacterised protein g4092 [Pycnogonum litorale]